jgi:hypothetical protein
MLAWFRAPARARTLAHERHARKKKKELKTLFSAYFNESQLYTKYTFCRGLVRRGARWLAAKCRRQINLFASPRFCGRVHAHTHTHRHETSDFFSTANWMGAAGWV